ERPERGQRDPGAMTLVGQGRVGEPGTDHGRAGGGGRSGDLFVELASRGGEQEGGGRGIAGRGTALGPGQQDLADALAEPRAPGLAREVHVLATRTEVGIQALTLGRLAATHGAGEGGGPATR